LHSFRCLALALPGFKYFRHPPSLGEASLRGGCLVTAARNAGGVGAAVPHYRGTGLITTRTCTPGISSKKSIFSVPVSPRPEDRIHRIVIRDSFRHRLVQPVGRVEPEYPGLARIVGASTAGDDDPVVGNIRTFRGGVEVVRDQPSVLFAPHRRGAVLVEVRPVGVQVAQDDEVLLCRVDPAGVLHHGIKSVDLLGGLVGVGVDDDVDRIERPATRRERGNERLPVERVGALRLRVCYAGRRQHNGALVIEVGVLLLAARPAESLARDVGVVGAVGVHGREECRQCGAGAVADLLDGDDIVGPDDPGEHAHHLGLPCLRGAEDLDVEGADPDRAVHCRRGFDHGWRRGAGLLQGRAGGRGGRCLSRCAGEVGHCDGRCRDIDRTPGSAGDEQNEHCTGGQCSGDCQSGHCFTLRGATIKMQRV